MPLPCYCKRRGALQRFDQSSFHKFSSFWGFSLVNTCKFIEINSCTYDEQFTEKKNAKGDTEDTLHSMANRHSVRHSVSMALCLLAVQYELHKLKVLTRVFSMKSCGTPGSLFTETGT